MYCLNLRRDYVFLHSTYVLREVFDISLRWNTPLIFSMKLAQEIDNLGESLPYPANAIRNLKFWWPHVGHGVSCEGGARLGQIWDQKKLYFWGMVGTFWVTPVYPCNCYSLRANA